MKEVIIYPSRYESQLSSRTDFCRIKFDLPNSFEVYLHDTPETRLFSYRKRSFNHG